MRKWFFVFFLLLMSSIVRAQVENNLRQIYMQAEEEYNIGRFDASIQLLDENMANFSGALKTSAYRLLSLCYLGKDCVRDAERYASLLLKEDPYYSASIHDPLRFADMVSRLKRGEEATITTASQQAESIEEAPVPVTLITEEMIKASGARTLADLLVLYVPGMSFIEGAEMNVAMHGVYSSSQEKILIMLDGHRLNSRTTNSEAPDYRISLDKIKQIEVLRGPASSLYGNVALTAVVNIITKAGRDVDGVKLSAGIGNNNTYRADFLMGKSGLDTDFMAWASVYSSQGEKRTIGTGDEEFYGKILQEKTMYIQGYNHKPAYDIGFKAQWNDFTFLFNTQYSKKVNQYNTVHYLGLYTYDDYRMVNGAKPGRSRQATHFDLSYSKNLSDKWFVKVSTFLDLENCSFYDVGGDSILPSDRNLVIPEGEVTDIMDMEGVFGTGLYQVQSWNDYTYGVTAQTNYSWKKDKWDGVLLLGTQIENYTMKDNTMLVGDQYERIVVTFSEKNKSLKIGHELNVSAFTQLKMNWNNFLIFNGGIRYDYKHRYNGRKANVISPRLSLIYKFNPNANLKFGYSHSFVDAPYLYRGSTIVTYSGGSSLDPEQMDALQLTYNYFNFSKGLKYEANVYYNRMKDLIYYDGEKMENMYDNAGSLKLLGIENVLSYTHNRSLAYLDLSYQWILDNTNYNTDGKYIYHVPNFMMNMMYRYQWLRNEQFGNSYIRMNLSVLSRQKSPLVDPYLFKGEERIYQPDNKVKARAVLNLGADYDFKRWALSMNVYNALGTKYYQGGGDWPVPVLQQSRSFVIRLAYKF